MLRKGTLIREELEEFCISAYTLGNVATSNIVRKSVKHMVDDILQQLPELKSGNYQYKFHNFNMCIITEHRKYKIWLGINCLVAENNFSEMMNLFANKYTHLNDTVVYVGENYRIENYSMVDGIVYWDVLQGFQESPLTLDEWDELFVEFVHEMVKTTDGLTKFPLDTHAKNLVLTNGKLMLIDYDWISDGISPNKSVNEVYEEVLDSTIKYYTDSYWPSDEHTLWWMAPIWEEYRNSNDLNQKSRELKERILAKRSESKYKWDYLHKSEANEMYDCVANIIINHNVTNILDIACGKSRWNEFIPSTYQYDMYGIDNDSEMIDYCRHKYPSQKFEVSDCMNVPDNGQYDCVVMGGWLYYMGREWATHTVESYVDSIIDKFNPKMILIQEPRPSKSHKSPDFMKLFDKYAYEVFEFDLDIRMGLRHVYCLYPDRIRPQRKIKADFNDNGANIEQPNFDIDKLRYGVYVTNTENLDSDRDGMITTGDSDIDLYIGVCAGLKGMIKAAINFKKEKRPMEFMWLDISPSAIDYKIWVDYKLRFDYKSNLDDILSSYIEDVDDRIRPAFGGNYKSIESALDGYLNEIGLTRNDWYDFLEHYRTCDKRYVKIDLINNVVLLNQLIDKYPGKIWFWFSNAFDWHQFRHTDQTFERWKKYLVTRNPTLECHGHTPPFTSM